MRDGCGHRFVVSVRGFRNRFGMIGEDVIVWRRNVVIVIRFVLKSLRRGNLNSKFHIINCKSNLFS